MDKEIYYCEAGGHYWYYGDDGEPKFAGWYDDPLYDYDNVYVKYCGCND